MMPNSKNASGRLCGVAFNRPTVLALTECPWRVISLANCIVLLQVQHNGDWGSPRVTGSTNRSKAASSAGSAVVQRFRPPPGARKRSGMGDEGFFARATSSRKPLRTVCGDIPVARHTASTPPQPYARASAAAHCRRIRSSIMAVSSRNFAAIRRVLAASCIVAGLNRQKSGKLF
jgi:hypothetical protein